MKPRMNILIGSISLLVLILVCVQIIWLYSANKKTEEATDLKIQRLMSELGDKLETSKDCVQLFTKYHLDSGDKFYINKELNNSSTADKVSMYYDFLEFRGDTTGLNIPYKYNSFTASLPVDVEVLLKVHFLPGEGFASAIRAQTISRDNFKQLLSASANIDEVFNMQEVDSTLSTVFSDNDIDNKYGFAFRHSNGEVVYTQRIADTNKLTDGYSTVLFSDNKFMPDYRLIVLFNQDSTWYSVNTLMLVSIVIILLLTYSFYSFVRLYRQQAKLSEMKTDFINNLTHEFNTPMANISLALETIEENKMSVNEHLSHILNIISGESKRLKDNIERALQVATLDKGAMALRSEVVDLSELITSIEPSYTLQCEQAGGKLTIIQEGECKVLGDEVHLLNCICNLLDNAIKYSKESPDVSISLTEETKHIKLVIADKGIGMTTETQQHIFDMFYRAHEGDMHNTKGFGVGLNYVKGIVEATHGKIEVWSKKGVGSKFTVQIPKYRK